MEKINLQLFAIGDTFVVNGITYYDLGDNQVQVGDGSLPATAQTGAITIPSTVQNGGITYDVITVGDKAFQNLTGITSLTVSEGITKIGGFACDGCTGLTTIVLPETITKINTRAFNNCTALTSLKVKALEVPTPEAYILGEATTATILVQPNMGDSYKSSGGWNIYADQIQEMEAVKGRLVLSNPVSDVSVTISAMRPYYSIAANLTHCTAAASNPNQIAYKGTATLQFTAESGYILPDTIFVNRASYTWDKATGTLVLSNPTGSVQIAIEAVTPGPGPTPSIDAFKMSSSSEAFTLHTANNSKNWDGTLESSVDGVNWTTWNGTTTLDSSTTSPYVLYLRGTGNTYITRDKLVATKNFIFTGSNISLDTRLDYLLDYNSVAGGISPTMTGYCYAGLFYNNANIINVANNLLPATTLTEDCYDNMFGGCTALTTAPNLPATTLADSCYQYMFWGCTNLYVSDTSGAGFDKEWRIPTTGVFDNTTTYNQGDMFTNCLGTRSSDDMSGATGESHTYYTQNDLV